MFSNLNKPLTAILLIFGSLAMLAIFLTFWVRDAYLDEKAILEKEISYAFKDIISSIEDSLVQQMLVQRTGPENLEIKAEVRKVKKKTTVTVDSVKLVHAQYDGAKKIEMGDSTVRMFIQTKEDSISASMAPSLLPILMNWREGGIDLKLDYEENTELAVKLITERFKNYIAGTSLPKKYKILSFNTKDEIAGLKVDFYQNPTTSKVYAAIFSDYSGYIFKRIQKNILFAGILFGAISFSFYLIYSNWRKQQRLIDIKNDFISNVTHELKTPISTVSVALEAITDFDVMQDKVKTLEYLQISQKELSRLKILVDKVLKMSIFEKGASKLKIEALQFDELVEEVLNSMKIQFEKEKAAVKKEVQGSDFSVEVDKIHLTNVVYNLLDNAMKYCKQNPIITVRLEESNGAVDLYIKDNGIGISEADKSKIFNRFYRVPSGDTHDVKGHGLGLSYVASVIEQHRGQINLQSTPSEGSTFHIRLNKTYGGK